MELDYIFRVLGYASVPSNPNGADFSNRETDCFPASTMLHGTGNRKRVTEGNPSSTMIQNMTTSTGVRATNQVQGVSGMHPYRSFSDIMSGDFRGAIPALS